MAIKKQEFYEGAALFQLIKTNKVESVIYAHPFYILNDKFALLLKYSTSKDSPWSFVLSPPELQEINNPGQELKYYLELICGSDGVVALSASQFNEVAPSNGVALRIGCQRKFDRQYRVSGPIGILSRRISSSAWTKILDGDES